MGKLSVFNFITLNGFYKGVNNDIGWHKHGEEEGEFSAEGAQSDSVILFGRVTYDMMYSFWPTPMAMESMPVVADGMNNSEKIVFSRTLKKAGWNNTRIISSHAVEEIKKLKKALQKDMIILGSGSIVTLCAEHGLIDTYQIMIDPVAIGNGTPLFNGMKRQLDLRLTSTRTFKSGVILLNYEPA
jgi:dihydrofolate reductase